jgi:hypothetical protein
MANIFPLVSETPSETVTLPIVATATTATHSLTVNSRTVKIDAQGADAACTHVVNVTAPNGMIFFVDFLDAGALNANGAAAAATSVTLKKGDNTILLDAVTEDACVLVTENGFVDGSNILGTVFNATTGATFA